MVARKAIVVGAIGICLLFLLGNVPTASAKTPTTGLDPNEQTLWDIPMWNCQYGTSNSYGAYLRHVYFNCAKYAGLISVPWVKINNGIHYISPTEEDPYSPYYTNLGGNDHIISFQYDWTATDIPSGCNFQHHLEINFHLDYQTSPQSAGRINIHVLHNMLMQIPPDPKWIPRDHTLEVPYRVDFDIWDENSDNQYLYTGWGWIPQFSETAKSDQSPRDPIFNTKVKQCEDEGHWGGIEPVDPVDNMLYYFLKWKSNEFIGDPGNYLNSEGLIQGDDVFWAVGGRLSPHFSKLGTSQMQINVWCTW